MLNPNKNKASNSIIGTVLCIIDDAIEKTRRMMEKTLLFHIEIADDCKKYALNNTKIDEKKITTSYKTTLSVNVLTLEKKLVETNEING